MAVAKSLVFITRKRPRGIRVGDGDFGQGNLEGDGESGGEELSFNGNSFECIIFLEGRWANGGNRPLFAFSTAGLARLALEVFPLLS